MKEVGRASARSAGAGIAKLLRRDIRVRVASARMMGVNAVPKALGGAQASVAAVRFRVAGPVSGSIVLVLPAEEARRLAALLVEEARRKFRGLDAFAVSALKELGNIATGSYLTALSEAIGMRLTHSVPGFATDMLGAVLDEILARSARDARQAVLLQMAFLSKKERARGHLIFLPDPEGLERLLKAEGLKR